MNWYQWFVVFCMASCSVACFYHFSRLVRMGNPMDFSKKRGNTGKAITYSFSGAMSPVKKESAFLHLPTYTAGIFYHLGTFAGMIILVFALFGIFPSNSIKFILVIFLSITGISGASILIKRWVNYRLRALSNPDDFISNILVTAFQLSTALMLTNVSVLPFYFVISGILLLYLPLGKLKHTVYFFAARYHLGIFYGWRGVWPPK